MKKVFDIMVDEDGDDIHRNGDYLTDECTQQNQKYLIVTDKGSLKHEPTTGVGVNNWILDEKDGEDLKAEIQKEFEGDGLRINKLQVKNLNDIRIIAGYAE